MRKNDVLMNYDLRFSWYEMREEEYEEKVLPIIVPVAYTEH